MKIFWAWQSDTPGNIGRFFVRDTLRDAIEHLKSEVEIVEPTERETREAMELDHDRKGVPGSPDLARTIMEKIEAAAVFVADVTPVGAVIIHDHQPSKKLINHNVAIELGYSLRARTDRSLIMVMNTHYGSRADMPFDVAHKGGPITFNLAPDADKKIIAAAVAKLKPQLVEAIKLCIADEVKEKKQQQPPFRARVASDNRGRFKAKNEPIGVVALRLLESAGTELMLADAPITWLRMMPVLDPGRTWTVSELKAAATTSGVHLAPLGRCWQSYGYFRNADGFGVYPPSRNEPGIAHSAAMIFTNGEIWSTDAYFLDAMEQDNRNIVPGLEDEFRYSLKAYAELLVRLGIPAPFRWIAGMENLRGRAIYVPAPAGRISSFGPHGSCLEDAVTAEGTYSPGEPLGQALKPFFAKLFDSCCVDRPARLDE